MVRHRDMETNERIAGLANDAVEPIAKQIIATMIDGGGSFMDVMALLELVSATVIVTMALQVSSEPSSTSIIATDLHSKGVRERVAKAIASAQLATGPTNGEA